MAELTAKIDREKHFVEFQGPGTYMARDKIKSLGNARWLGDRKVWRVMGFEPSADELRQHFPGLLVIQSGGEPEKDTESESSPRAPSTIGGRDGSPSATKGIPEGFSVSQFVRKVRSLLRASFPGTVYIYGVLSQVKDMANGRVYMELAEGESSGEVVRCVVWRNSDEVFEPLLDAGFEIESDLPVMFKVAVDMNPRNAQISLTVRAVIVEYTLGKLAALRDVTNERLKQEGLFDKNKALSLPFLPIRLGVITSAGGTVINDFRASLDESEFAFEILWLPIGVQGAEAAKHLKAGIERMGEVAGLDALLIFRGGGSPADLAVFSDYELAKAVCLCPVPVFSAIGHEEDQSSVQDVSYRSFGVPKDIGHFFAEIVLSYRRDLSTRIDFILTSATVAEERKRESLALFSRSLVDAMSLVSARRGDSLINLSKSLPRLAAIREEGSGEQLRNVLGFTTSLCERVFADRRGCVENTARRIGDFAAENRRRYGEKLRYNAAQVVRSSASVLDRSRLLLGHFADLGTRAMGYAAGGEREFLALERTLREGDPARQLERGFAIVRRGNGSEIVKRGDLLKRGERIAIEFCDTARDAEVR